MSQISIRTKVIESNGFLIANVVSDEILPEGSEFAFNINKNGKQIHVEWYSVKNEYSFNLNNEPGYYTVTGFIKLPAGEKIGKTSPPFYYCSEISELGNLQKPLPPAIVAKSGNIEIPSIFYAGSEPNLFVILPSAVTRSAVTLPFFNRFTWAAKNLFPGNVLCISDPTLNCSEKLSIGWCKGNENYNLPNLIADFIKEVADTLGIESRNIVLWGSSAGGYSSLEISELIGDCTAVAINPQTNINIYENQDQVKLLKVLCFPNLSEENPDSFKVEKTSKANVKRIIIQNRLDTHHYENHFPAIATEISENYKEIELGWNSKGNTHIFIFDDPKGHVAETEEMAKQAIDIALNS
ncbi:hypothetical protein [Comamonas testosteroni]|uniref:hypothetical protein n=1 Tax=Comamonas testosteroni TaxID=285 RepID=UPI000AB5B88E|nr:hypothetical protein [Comamonas testosteroni]